MPKPRKKSYRLAADQIQPLATMHGACIASDMITCEGRKVGFMYRQKPDNGIDSGWRFMAGDESQDYMDDPENHGLHDVNTIANYDPDIVPLLNAPIGSAYERKDANGPLVEVHDFTPED